MSTDPSHAIDKAGKIASDSVSDSERTLNELARKVERSIQDGLAELRARSRGYADVAGEQFDTAQRYVVDRVQERPVAATLTALGVGVLVGVLLSGRKR